RPDGNAEPAVGIGTRFVRDSYGRYRRAVDGEVLAGNELDLQFRSDIDHHVGRFLAGTCGFLVDIDRDFECGAGLQRFGWNVHMGRAPYRGRRGFRRRTRALPWRSRELFWGSRSNTWLTGSGSAFALRPRRRLGLLYAAALSLGFFLRP